MFFFLPETGEIIYNSLAIRLVYHKIFYNLMLFLDKIFFLAAIGDAWPFELRIC